MRVGDKLGAARRRRRWPRIAGGILAVLVLAAAGLIQWRVALAEAALRAGLAEFGFADANVAIESIDLRRIRIARFAIGRELTVTDLTIALDLERFRTRPVASVTIGALTLDLTRPDGPLRRLLAERMGKQRPANAPPRLADLLDRRGQAPNLAIDALRLRLPGERGVLDLQGDMLSRDDGQGGLTATIALRGVAAAGDISLALDARAFLDLRDTSAAVTLRATAPQAGATLDLGVWLEGLPAAPTARGEGALRIADLARLAAFAPEFTGLGGSLGIEVRTTAPLPVRLDARTGVASLLASLRRQGGLVARLRAENISHAAFPPVNARARIALGPGEARVSVTAEAVSLAATGNVSLTIADPHGRPKASIQATMRLGDLSRLAAYIPALAGVAGTLDGDIATTAPIEIPPDALTNPAALGELARQGGGLKAVLRADTEIAGRRLRGTIEATLNAGPDTATLMLRAAAPDAGAKVDMTLTVRHSRGMATANLQAAGGIASLSRLAGFVPALAGFDGAVRFRARTTTPVALPASAAELAAVSCRGNRGSLALEADGLRRAGMIDGLAGTVDVALRCDDARGGTAEIGLKLTAGRVTAGQVSVTKARLAGPLRARWQGPALTLELPTALKLTLDAIATPTVKAGPVQAALTAGKQPALQLALDDLRTNAVRFDISAAIEPLAITVPGGRAPPVGINLSTSRLTASGSAAGGIELNFDAGRADVVREDIALGLTGIKARVTRPGRGKAVSFHAATRLDTAMAGRKLLAPLDMELRGRFRNSMLDFDAAATGPAGLSVTARGRHDVATGAGTAEIALARLQFGDGGALLSDIVPGQPRTYAPRSGALEARARIGWGEGKFDGTADVTVEDMRIANADGSVSIDGLTTRLRFDQLWPPITAPGQRLAVRRIQAGVRLDDLKLRFALRPGASATRPVMAIADMRAGFAGGVLSGQGITFDPARAVNRALVRVDGIDLKALLEIAGVEGLSGTGVISGAIPFRMENNAVAIDRGVLSAAGPGILRFKSDAVRQALDAGGEYVALALQALEDFRYRKLTIGIDKALAGEGSVRLRVEGHNPAILDAHPFAINLNVSGNVDRLAGIAARLMMLPDEIVRSIVPNAR